MTTVRMFFIIAYAQPPARRLKTLLLAACLSPEPKSPLADRLLKWTPPLRRQPSVNRQAAGDGDEIWRALPLRAAGGRCACTALCARGLILGDEQPLGSQKLD